MSAAPDVSVVVAVYNTMPYLTECLNSLVGQTIGRERLEIVAVDDGSTDDSGRELDRFAALYPDTVKVIHQPNSGGPAAPSNRALEVATGRYVYFIGSDDYLGEEALERMVRYADKHDSDVVVGKMVGTNGRYVHQALYQHGNRDVPLDEPGVPFTLANTKLFRRELVEKHKLRFPEHMAVGSDQPFTIEALVRARKISVVADYTCYYAVKRGDASNITYRADHLSRLECTAEMMNFAAGLIEAGPQRDALLRRHFTWELAKLVQDDFPALDRALRERICAGIARLADAYFTDGIREAMDVRRRVRIALAQAGAVDELCEAIVSEPRDGVTFVVEDDRTYARYAGFRDPRIGLADRVYEVLDGDSVAAHLAPGVRLLASEWEQQGDGLAYTASVRVPLAGVADGVSLRLAQGAMPKSADKNGARKLKPNHKTPAPVGEQAVKPAEDGAATVLHARVPLEYVTAKRGVRVYLDVAGATYEVPVRGTDLPMPLARRWGREGDPYRASAIVNDKGRVVVDTARMFPPKSALVISALTAFVRKLKSLAVRVRAAGVRKLKSAGLKKPTGSKRK
ncbi:glycosyltransferase [Streptomyces sp. NBC_00704]|uniref:glycosyltransferase family 2 protein n=1 Tax=Streptomyces sp. NBC_00704 TaxID=2975809 RepID=UPI002E36FC1F|nr:glycosyltransferase [Streptomyces sp. NBC_00704]